MIDQHIGGCSSRGDVRDGAKGDPFFGRLVDGRYRVRAKLGEGAMGVVYDGVHEALERRVAIKILRGEHRSEPVPLETFHREARTLATIANPHIVEVHDLGELEAGRAYVVTEHLEGQTLSDLLDERGFIPWREAVEIALQVCDGMQAAHEAGIVHRDLKPDNLFLARSHPRGVGTCVKILDFGVAKLLDGKARDITFAGRLAGTPEYMAPEQCRGLEVDARADVYALGAIVFEMVSGAPPFEGESVFAVLERQLREPVPHLALAAHPVVIPSELDRTVRRCLAKDPDERFESMEALSAALYELVAIEDDVTLPSEPPPALLELGAVVTRERPSGAPLHVPPVPLAMVGAIAGLSFVALWLLGALALLLATLTAPSGISAASGLLFGG